MKKILISLVMTVFCISLYAGDNDKITGPPENTSLNKTTAKDITDGGFFFHLTANIPSKNYFFPPDYDNDTDKKFGFGGGFELGTMFKISDVSNNAIGVKALWLSAMYTGMKINDTLQYGAAHGSTLRVGPYFTVGINKDMAIDFYYTIGPTGVFEVWEGLSNYLGVTHNVGASYRMNILSVGMDFNFGSIKDFDCFNEDTTGFEDLCKARTTHLRFFVGIKM